MTLLQGDFEEELRHTDINGIDGERLRTSAPQRAAEAGPDGLLHPDAIAETYWQLHQQHRAARGRTNLTCGPIRRRFK
jgi:hypothetical protein